MGSLDIDKIQYSSDIDRRGGSSTGHNPAILDKNSPSKILYYIATERQSDTKNRSKNSIMDLSEQLDLRDKNQRQVAYSSLGSKMDRHERERTNSRNSRISTTRAKETKTAEGLET